MNTSSIYLICVLTSRGSVAMKRILLLIVFCLLIVPCSSCAKKNVLIYIKIQFFALVDGCDATLAISFHEAENDMQFMF